MRTQLENLCAVSVDLAVDTAVHDADPKRFHKRYPKGQCPQCGLVKNLLAFQDIDLSRMAEQLRESVRSTYQDDDTYHDQA